MNDKNRIYISRHLERIDLVKDINGNNNKWKDIDSLKKEHKHNPYLCERNSYKKLIKNIKDKNIDIIITSPFLRCMLTSQIAFNYINKMDNNKIKNILVDYGLSEWNDSVYVNEDILDTSKIFRYSKNYYKINSKNFKLFRDKYKHIKNEYDKRMYMKRIVETLNNINKIFKGKNILIITHGHSLKYGNIITMGKYLNNYRYLIQ